MAPQWKCKTYGFKIMKNFKVAATQHSVKSNMRPFLAQGPVWPHRPMTLAQGIRKLLETKYMIT